MFTMQLKKRCLTMSMSQMKSSLFPYLSQVDAMNQASMEYDFFILFFYNISLFQLSPFSYIGAFPRSCMCTMAPRRCGRFILTSTHCSCNCVFCRSWGTPTRTGCSWRDSVKHSQHSLSWWLVSAIRSGHHPGP